MYGWGADDISVDQTPMTFDFKRDTMETIQWIGLAANCLKNREWRQSQYLVDLYVFEQRLRKAFNLYLNLLRTRLTDDEILDCWSLKYQVNIFRIQTKY